MCITVAFTLCSGNGLTYLVGEGGGYGDYVVPLEGQGDTVENNLTKMMELELVHHFGRDEISRIFTGFSRASNSQLSKFSSRLIRESVPGVDPASLIRTRDVSFNIELAQAKTALP